MQSWRFADLTTRTVTVWLLTLSIHARAGRARAPVSPSQDLSRGHGT